MKVRWRRLQQCTTIRVTLKARVPVEVPVLQGPY